ncbi:MAG: hypothetical protein HGA75_19195, partial [Thiobacillus sp.]|nr:hypothetical protein [Thiobacillus sp.]
TDHAAVIDGLMGELAQATGRIMPMAGADQQSTRPVYGPVNGAGYGTSATVLRLTNNRDFTGSTPRRSLHTPAYTRLNQRREGGRSYYVLGHLLNHNIGGPGDRWENLTPLTQGANNSRTDSMLHGFEKQVKDTVDAPDPANRRAVNFAVTANYGMPSRSTDAGDALANARAADNDNAKRRWLAVREVVLEEQTIPRNVSLNAYTLDAAGNRGPRLGSSPVVDNLPAGERAIDGYSVNPRPNILEDHRSEL